MQYAEPAAALPNFAPLRRSIIISVVLPAIATAVLTHAGMPLPRATLIAAVFPVAEVIIGWRETRRLDAIAVLSLILMAAGFATSAASGDVRLVFVKDSALTMIAGLSFLGSLVLPRPLIFYVSRSYMAGASADAWEEKWRSLPGFRTTMRTLTAIWGAGLLLDAVARLALLRSFSPATIAVVSPVIAIVTFAALIVWTT
ncbi:MAG: hypothetical protein IAI50_12945, partial [Candidatus Eremiobacteraeota bacterium]|nr:hypothetical protein [Candidatus Eremiobacteraeota bacterium]